MAGDVEDHDHFKTVVSVTVEVTHQFGYERTVENMIRSALNFPAISKLSINNMDTREVKVKK